MINEWILLNKMYVSMYTLFPPIQLRVADFDDEET